MTFWIVYITVIVMVAAIMAVATKLTWNPKAKTRKPTPSTHQDRCRFRSDPMPLWVVGQVKFPQWELHAIFDDEAKAVAACKDATYFVGPWGLNEERDDQSSEWSGAYYPLALRECWGIGSERKW